MTRNFVPTILVVAGLGFSTAGHTQDYPNRPIRLIVPFAPGGTSDIVGRLVGAKLSDEIGETVVVDNRGGAGSALGTAIAARARADGYTLIVSNEAMATHEAIYSKLPYSSVRDFTPISKIGVSPAAVVVNNASPSKTMRDLLAIAKKSPGKLNYASGGVGSPGHLAVALLEYTAGLTLNHIAYKGGGLSLIATITGEVQFAVTILATVAPHAKAGRLRMLAVTGAKRSPAVPDVPTVAEAGVPGYDYAPWFGIFAPAGTPKAVISRLEQAIVKVLDTHELREQLSRQGFESESSTSDELAKILHADVAKWTKVIKAAGIRINY